MPTTPVASPSSPSTKLTALEHSTMKKTVMATEAVAIQGDDLTGQRDPQHPDPEGDHDAGRQHLAGELGQRGQVEQVVEHPDQADHPGGDEDGAGVLLDDHLAAQERQLPGEHDRRQHPGEHGYAAEVRHRDGVHVTVPDLGQGAGAQGESPTQAAGQK